jgi:hypothetical protein
MRILTDPRALAELTEIDPRLPTGDGDRFSGYGVMGLPFLSGHILTLRRFPASSIGYGYSSVWHRDPSGRWTFWSDVAPEHSCARFFGRGIHRALQSPIRIQWTGANALSVVVDEAGMEWHMALAASPVTIVLNAAARILPARVWHEPRTLHIVGAVASRLLGTGRLTLTGRAPNGDIFHAIPRAVWRVATSRARVGSVDVGLPGPLPVQAQLAGLVIPQRGLFVIGRSRLARPRPAAESAPGICAVTPTHI